MKKKEKVRRRGKRRNGWEKMEWNVKLGTQRNNRNTSFWREKIKNKYTEITKKYIKNVWNKRKREKKNK